MATITVKNIPDELYAQLKAAAARNRRSINSEVIVCIERNLTNKKAPTEAMIKNIRRIRNAVVGEHGVEEIDAMKREGRA